MILRGYPSFSFAPTDPCSLALNGKQGGHTENETDGDDGRGQRVEKVDVDAVTDAPRWRDGIQRPKERGNPSLGQTVEE